MPTDEDGNVAGLITSPDSVPGRMNLGRLYGPYFNSAARDVRRLILEQLGYNRHHQTYVSVEELMSIKEDQYRLGCNTLLHFYSIVSPRSYNEFIGLNKEDQFTWMQMIVNEAIYLYFPIEAEENIEQARLFYDEMIVEIEKNFKITYGPVSYVGRSGKRVTTKNNFRIAPLYIMPLDRIADTWLAVDVGKHSNFGILAAMNENDKFASPWHRTPPRTLGETECRLYNMYGGREMIAELLDRSGSIETQYEIAKNVISAPNPSNIDHVVDRNKVPLGDSRSNQIAHHIFRSIGFDVIYEPEEQKHAN